MKKRLTSVGNSKAVILPAEMIKKYKLAEGDLVIEETEAGILIRPSNEVSAFAKALEKLRSRKYEVYKRMSERANDPATQDYYAGTGLEDVDTEVIDQ